LFISASSNRLTVSIKNFQIAYNLSHIQYLSKTSRNILWQRNILSHHPSHACSHEQTNTYTIKWAGWPMHKTSEEPAINIMTDVPQEVDAWNTIKKSIFQSPI